MAMQYNDDHQHQCFIYDGSPSAQLPALAGITKKKLEENYRCLYLNSPLMVEAMYSHLEAAGVNVANAIAEDDLILSSDPAVIEGGKFDIDIMIQGLEDSVNLALKDGYKGLFATGDMTWEFGAAENYSKLLQYEWRLEKLFQKQPALSGICQYHRDTLPHEAVRQGFLSHAKLFVNETLSLINQCYAQSEPDAENESKNPELDKKIAMLCRSQYAY